MTDNEIIKALECCGADSCNYCPFYDDELGCDCNLQFLALDLINRQKAEIENLQGKCKMYEDERKYNFAMSRQRTAEAIKEFAGRVKESAFSCDVSFGYGQEHCEEAVTVLEIDNLVKEMTEEQP